jgi:catechol 2,3-dioxygenase-like lactoylglutathione lyase family enzyme
VSVEPGEKYWSILEPIWDSIDIGTPEVFEQTFGAVPRSVGLLYAAHFCQSEVCNGGLTQFFWNSTGVLAPEAVDGFQAIGQAKVASVVQRAVKMLGDPYPRVRSDRWQALEKLRDHPVGTDSSEQPSYENVALFEPLEDEFYSLLASEAGGFENAADAYATAKPAAAREPQLLGAVPQLFVSDVKASCRFFVGILGFAIQFHYGEPAYYALVARDAARLNLRFVHEPVPDRKTEVDLLAASIPVANIEALYREYSAAGAPMHQALKEQPWGRRDFIVRDPDGNLIHFSE